MQLTAESKYAKRDRFHDSPTRDRMICTMGGMDEKATVMAPNRPMAKLEMAAARGSTRNSRAVPNADAFAPNVTPRVT